MAHRSDGENHDDDCCFYFKAFYQAFPGGSDSKETACNVGDQDLTGKLSWRRECPHSSILVWRILWTEEPGEL